MQQQTANNDNQRTAAGAFWHALLTSGLTIEANIRLGLPCPTAALRWLERVARLCLVAFLCQIYGEPSTRRGTSHRATSHFYAVHRLDRTLRVAGHSELDEAKAAGGLRLLVEDDEGLSHRAHLAGNEASKVKEELVRGGRRSE